MPNNNSYYDALDDVSNYADSSILSRSNLSIRKDNEVPNAVGGAVDVKVFNITVKDGRSVSMLDVYRSIAVQESIFSSFITGTVKIADIGAVLEKFMIRGGEIIELKVFKSSDQDILIWRADLVVTKITTAEFDVVSGAAMYNLHFAPRTYVNSLKTCLFKSYKNQSISDAVLSIYREISTNNLFIENSKITLTTPFISAGFMPHKAIDYLAQRACSKNKYFVFFERFVPNYGSFFDSVPFTSSHYFGSIDRLIDESEDLRIKTIVFTPKLYSISEGTTIRASKFSTQDNYNHISAMQLGFYNSKITSINPITKEVQTSKIAYTDPNEEIKDLHESRLLDDANIFSIYDDVNNQVPGRKLITSSINDSVPRENWLKDHIYGYLSKNYFKITVEIQGGTNRISAGHIVNFFTPSAYSKLYENDASIVKADIVHSGKYLVTKAIHVIANGMYVKTLELARASMPYDVNRYSLFDSTIEQITKDILGDRRT